MSWRQGLWQDVQYALRMGRRNPGFVLAAAGVLGLGIGATTAIFSILNGVLLRPLPFAEPARLVQLQQTGARNEPSPIFLADAYDWLRGGASLESVATYGFTGKNLLDVPDPERLQAVWSDGNLFQVLGAAPLLGRFFTGSDEPEVAVLSASLWKRRFGADPHVVGRKITLDGQPFQVLGVMPENFEFPFRAARTELWIPYRAGLRRTVNRMSRVEFAVARLKRGITLNRARAELRATNQRLAQAYPDTNRERRLTLTPLAEFVGGDVGPALTTLLGAVALLLLIACANVANLLLARAARRSHEIAVRVALGASRARVVRQLLTESALLSLLGGASGLLVAVAGSKAILRLAGTRIPRSWDIGLDWRVFAFLLLTSALTGLAFGIIPALAAAGRDPHTALKRRGVTDSGVTGRGFRNALVVAEIAFSFVLLAGAGLLLRGFLRLEATPTGFAIDNTLTARLTVSLSDYRAPGSYGRYLDALEDRLRQIPGVRSSGFIQYLPLLNFGWWGNLTIPAQGPTPQRVELRYVSPGYFETMGIPLRRGRLLSARDTAGAPPAIVVNETLARRYFPNGDAVGQRTDRGVIAGIVGDVRAERLDAPATPEVYYTFAQNPAATSDAGVSLIVRAAVPPLTLARAVTDAVREVNPRQVVYDVKTLDGVVAESLATSRLYVWLIACFAGLAMLLAVAGIYGVIAYVVSARTQEFGIRIALGAAPSRIFGFVLAHASWLVAGGLLIGMAGTLAAGRVLQSLMRGVNAADPAMLAGAAILLGAAGLAACLGPARRATRVDPVLVLKNE